MNANPEPRDFAVIGGGPAGSTASTLLRQHGYDVLLLERERFPRDHVGESLLPFCYDLFERLGVLDAMKRRFVRKPGVRFIDRNGERSTRWCFRLVIQEPRYLSFHVSRAEFDALLLSSARERGVDVHEETAVRRVETDVDDGLVRLHVTSPEGPAVHRARYLIDASGRDAFLATRNGWRRPHHDLARTAFWSHWTGVKLRGGLEEGLSVIVYMGGEKKGWIWVFPLAEDRLTVGVVTGNEYLREEKRRLLEAGERDWRRALYLRELEESGFVQGLLERAEMVLPVLVNGDYSYRVERQYGPRYALIGDARGFIDPIFSSGVFLSMKSAQLVADALHAARESGRPDDPAALDGPYAMIDGAYRFVHRMIRLFYDPHAVSWAELGSGEAMEHERHASAMAAGHYMLAGDFFENHEKYNHFFSVLESPNQFRRYKKVVIDREGYNPPTCGAHWDDVFGGMTDSAPTS